MNDIAKFIRSQVMNYEYATYRFKRRSGLSRTCSLELLSGFSDHHIVRLSELPGFEIMREDADGISVGRFVNERLEAITQSVRFVKECGAVWMVLETAGELEAVVAAFGSDRPLSIAQVDVAAKEPRF
jgi:hypothetical protein